MPLVFQKTYSWGTVAAWRIAEDEEVLTTIVKQSDLESVAGIRSSSKRVERLSWRALLRSVMPSAGVVVYDEYGAPHVDGIYLSVSHNRDYAVVAISEICRCAIDIELISRDFEKVSDRYISKEEAIIVGLETLSTDERQRARCAVWCAKEALYKYSCRDNLDFLSNLRVISYEKSSIFGKIVVDKDSIGLKMDILEVGDSLLVVGGSSS